MEHLRNFKIFESNEDDEGSKIYTGFEYSFNDIKDTLWDILYLGFTIKESEHELWSENFINTTKMTNQVKTKSFQEIRDSINDLKNWNLPKESIVELRKITKEDCKKLAEIAETGIKTKEYMEERYLDLDAIVVKFNYQKC